MDKKTFKQHFQFEILNGLKFRAKNTAVKGSFFIKKGVYEELIQQGIGGRFKSVPYFTNKFELTSTIDDEGDYCFANPNEFQIRVGKEKKLIANGQTFKSGVFLFSFTFRRHFCKG
jgi:hypothetical protein